MFLMSQASRLDEAGSSGGGGAWLGQPPFWHGGLCTELADLLSQSAIQVGRRLQMHFCLSIKFSSWIEEHLPEVLLR